MISGAIRKLTRSIRRRGVGGTLEHAARAASARARAAVAGGERRAPACADTFDATFGLDTGGRVDLADLHVPGRSWEYARWYQPIAPEWFHRMMRDVQVRHEDFVFVDIGSGKGRAVLLAASYPFRRIVGVELARDLHLVAERNRLAYARHEARASRVELVCEDALRFPLPPAPTVLYLYNPFEREIMAPFVARVARSLAEHPRDLVVVYATPLLGHLWAEAPGMELVCARADYQIHRARRFSGACR